MIPIFPSKSVLPPTRIPTFFEGGIDPGCRGITGRFPHAKPMKGNVEKSIRDQAEHMIYNESTDYKIWPTQLRLLIDMKKDEEVHHEP